MGFQDDTVAIIDAIGNLALRVRELEAVEVPIGGGGMIAHTHDGAVADGGSLAIGTTDTDAAPGSVFFAGVAGVIQEDNAGLFYDNTNSTVGIRSNIPHTLADALYVPWITGDTQTTSLFGSSDAGNDQTAIGATSYDATTILAQAQSASAIGGTTNSATVTDFGVLGWATGAAGGVSAQSATGTALYVNLTGAGTIAIFADNGTPVWTFQDGGNLLPANGGTLGQAAGPLLTFNDTSNYLGITGCNIGFGTLSPGSLTEWNFADDDIEFVDAHAASAVGNISGVIEVQRGGATEYIALYDGYTP